MIPRGNRRILTLFGQLIQRESFQTVLVGRKHTPWDSKSTSGFWGRNCTPEFASSGHLEAATIYGPSENKN